MQFLRNLFDSNERDIQSYRKKVEKINALEPAMKALPDEQLKAKTAEFKERVAATLDAECERRSKTWEELEREEKRVVSDAALDPILTEAFAVCREAASRTLKMRPFDVQLIGGMVLHDGRIAEMKTGEGKTLTATLPIYLNALTGKGVHLVTVNDYLSKVGAVAMGPLYHFLGLSVGIIQGQSPETGDIGGTYIYDPEYRHPDPRYDFARPADTRRDGYDCDITYGTNNEYGFDYLRDNLAVPGQELNQPELIFAIVDEVDSILIDEARTPLIISGQAEESSELYVKMDRIIRMLQIERDYTLEEKQKTATFTEDGQRRVEAALGVQNLSDPENVSLMQHANAALRAHAVYKRDIDYLVRANDEGKAEVVIIDEFTGRLMFGRRWSDGLHQAVEAKEGVKIENENKTLATITFQNLFRLYPKLAGMTGTAKTEEDEFRKIYALDVVVVPTNKPMIRVDHADIIYRSEEAKLRGIAREILTLFARQQPVLVGTRSVEMSERVSDRLRYDRLEMLGLTDLLRDKLDNAKGLDKAKYAEWSALLNQKLHTLTPGKMTEIARHFGTPTSMKDSANIEALRKLLEITPEDKERLEEALTHGIPHNILNAKSHEREARIISEAGRLGAVTIATNMAGRGVDILLGGSLVNDEGEEKPDTYEYRRGGKPIIGLTPVGERGSKEHQEEADRVRALGGLFVLGSERHESRRIDNQLRGRSGRQGDPGASRFYVSLEDELWRLFGDKANSPLIQGWAEEQAIDAKILSTMIARAQKKVEMHYFDMRKSTLDYDDVMNVQREKIYGERRRIMEGADLRDTIAAYLVESVQGDINLYAPEGVSSEEWDLDGLYNSLNKLFPLVNYAQAADLKGKTRDELIEYLTEIAERSYADKERHFAEVLGEEEGVTEMRNFERQVTLQALDRHWMEHLSNMEYLREGIGWRGYAGIDPLVLYKKEAYDMFQQMLGSMQDEVVRVMSFIHISIEPPPPVRTPATAGALRMRGADEDGMGGAGPFEEAQPAGAGPHVSRADRRRMAKAKSRRH
ncbi:MAG: preprotein translocase subunit SecA [Armatimonadetes bacterium]|nr:preprotein translocase subunit SecA [Armatimonadota bacterium]